MPRHGDVSEQEESIRETESSEEIEVGVIAENGNNEETSNDVVAAEEETEEAETVVDTASETVSDEDADGTGDEPAEVPVPEDETAVEAAVPATEPETMAEALEQAPDVPTLKKGQVIDGTITSTSPTEVLVDIGAKTEGIIPSRELERMSKQLLEELQPGNIIPVFVVNPNDHQGNIILSVNRALEVRDWERAEAALKNNEIIESHIAGYNKGGLIVRFGRVRGFVPQTQLADERLRRAQGDTPEERWGSMINNPIAVRVIEVDSSRNRLILSERRAARETREKRKEALINELRVGEVRTGHVVSLESFGAFVDIGGAEGLVHLTEITWGHIASPADVLKPGQEVTVEVISIDRERKRIGLSMKSQEPDPWDEIALSYSEGQLVQATVTKLTKFGAFAQLVDAKEIEGLIHISELSEHRVAHPREVLQVNDKVTLRVIKVDVVNRRLGLSLKQVNSAEYLDMDWDAAMRDNAGSGEHTDTTSETTTEENTETTDNE